MRKLSAFLDCTFRRRTIICSQFPDFSMAGVQSFVAQRHQSHQSPSRQNLGAQHRVPVPRTNLDNIEGRPSLRGPNAIQPAGVPVAGCSTHWSKQQSANIPVVHGGFDTDVEDFDDTATMSTGVSSRCHQGEEDDRDPESSRYVADTAVTVDLGAHVSFLNRQQHMYHIQRSKQSDSKDTAGEADEASYSESPDEEGDQESDENELIHDRILQDLNSPGFSQYLQGQTSDTTRAAFQSVVAAPEVHSSLATRDIVQHSQKAAKPSKPIGNVINRGAADPNMNLQPANHHTYERLIDKSLRMPVQKVHGQSKEQSSFSAQRARLSDHQLSSQQPSDNFHQTWRPTEEARDIMATHLLPQATENRPLFGQKGSIDHSAAESSVAWGSDEDRRRARIPKASVDVPQTRKRTRDLDYSPDQMLSMTFNQLSNEPFDLASDPDRPSLPQDISSGTLTAKMDYIFEKLKDDETKFIQRRAFFLSLSIEQYEECAKLMIGQFSAIILKLTDARQNRRRVAKDFEEEVAKREGRIRGKTAIVSNNLGRLKRGGEEVVRGAAS